MFHIPHAARRVLVPLALAVISFVVYANTIGNGFVWDDEHLILLDNRLTDDSPVHTLFTVDFFAQHDDKVKYGYYRPVVTLSYFLELTTFGRSATGFHLMNLLMHVICVLLVWSLGMRLFEGKEAWAVAGAMLFAVHPVHTESVSWISGRTDVLATLFFLAALNVHIRFKGASRARRSVTVIIACVCLMAAILSKEVALSFPIVIFIWERAVEKRKLLPSIAKSLSYVAVIVAYGLWRFLLISVDVNASPHQPFHIWALTAAKTFWLYIGELFWPLPLMAHQINPWLTQFDWRWVASGLALVATVGIGFFLRKRRPAGFLYLAFAASLIPMANIIRISAPLDMGFPMAERFLYLPSVFFCLALGYVIIGLVRTKWIGPAIMALLLVACGAATTIRNRDWADDISFFSVTLEKAPGSSYFMGLLAGARLRRGRLEEAEEMYRQALSTYKKQTGNDQPAFAIGLALTLVHRGRYKDALNISKPLELVMTENATLAFVVGESYRKMHKLDEAEGAYVRSLSIQKDYLPSRIGLALVASSRGDHQRALQIYKTVIDIESGLPIVHEAMGEMHRRMGKIDKAIEEFEKAIEQDPSNYVAYGSLGSIAAAKKDFDRAQTHYRKALDLNPEFHEATISLAMIQAERGNLEKAEQSMASVLAKDGKNTAALLNLGILYAKLGRIGRARYMLNTLLALDPGHVRAKTVLEQIDRETRGGR